MSAKKLVLIVAVTATAISAVYANQRPSYGDALPAAEGRIGDTSIGSSRSSFRRGPPISPAVSARLLEMNVATLQFPIFDFRFSIEGADARER